MVNKLTLELDLEWSTGTVTKASSVYAAKRWPLNSSGVILFV